MLRPHFFEPKPVLENIHINFEDIKCKLERKKPILKRKTKTTVPIVSILGKRTIQEAFGQGMNDCERYGQEIPPDFFKTNSAQ